MVEYFYSVVFLSDLNTSSTAENTYIVAIVIMYYWSGKLFILTELTWTVSGHVMFSMSSSKLVVPTVTNTVFMAAPVPPSLLRGPSVVSWTPRRLFLTAHLHPCRQPRTWQLLPLDAVDVTALTRVTPPPTGLELQPSPTQTDAVEKYQFECLWAYFLHCNTWNIIVKSLE